MKSPKDGLDSSAIIRLIKDKKSDFWISEQEKKSLELFHKAAKEVPAYKSFLKKNKIDPRQIAHWKDLQHVPSIGKKDYLRKHSLKNLTMGGDLKNPLVFTSTSGSTGESFYFHRSFKLDWQSSIIHELFYLNGQYRNNEPVLIVVCFGMGVWIGGLITYQAFRFMQERGHNFSIITPGINKEEIFKSIKNLGPLYKNIILAGYPPFIKDVVEEASAHGVHWSHFKTRIIFAAETFSEDFRKHIAKVVHIKNPLVDTMNIYGTADLGTMAFETPLAILIRRLCAKSEILFNKIFKNIQKTPTLCQYIPTFTSFDTEGDTILVNGDNSLPLLRYALGDNGGACSFNDMVERCYEAGVDLRHEIKKAGIEKHVYELPFVYVYERKDLSIKQYGAIIYPEHIRQALHYTTLDPFITGKFTMVTKFDKKFNEYIEINCELKKNSKPSQMLRNAIKKAVIEELLRSNAEYANNFKSMPKKVEPHIVLWENEDPLYFRLGTKQKWVKISDALTHVFSKKNG